MRLNTEKQKSLAVLQLSMALLMILIPSLTGIIDSTASAYALIAVAGFLLIKRCKDTGEVYFGVFQASYMLLLIYAIISSLWVTNRNAHFEYITVVLLSLMFFILVTDYFSENTEENIGRRIQYMLSASGVICAIINVVYWLNYLVPEGKSDGLAAGTGSSDFLAVFMVLSIALVLKLIKGNSRKRRNLFVLAAAVMLFVLIMTKSMFGWIFAGALIITYAFTSKWKNMFFPIALVTTGIFFIITLVSGIGSGSAFKDVFAFGIKSVLGNGGGFWSAKESFLASPAKNGMPGLIASLCGASGIIGVLVCVVILIRVIWQFLKAKTWTGFICMLITIMLMLLPLPENYGVIILWTGLMAYNEKEAFSAHKKSMNKEVVKKFIYTTAVLCVLAVFMLCQQFIKISAQGNYKKGKYTDAYRLYNTVSNINIADAESPQLAAQALLKSGRVKENYDEAIRLIEKARKKDKNNLINMKIKAEIYYECGMYEHSVKEYTLLASKAKINDEYNLRIAESLFKIVEKKPKGSSDAKTAYDKMIEIANSTHNLDYKEKINDIAVDTFEYTKGELNVEDKN